MRASQKPCSSAATKKVHGSGDINSPTASAEDVKALAQVPTTVPELPSSYLVRSDDLSQLKGALLAAGGTSSASLTSAVRGGQQQKHNKVGAHGMVSLRNEKSTLVWAPCFHKPS